MQPDRLASSTRRCGQILNSDGWAVHGWLLPAEVFLLQPFVAPISGNVQVFVSFGVCGRILSTTVPANTIHRPPPPYRTPHQNIYEAPLFLQYARKMVGPLDW